MEALFFILVIVNCFAIAFQKTLIDGRIPYYILEELPGNTLMGNIAIDSNLTRKYDAIVQSQLSYSFLNQRNDEKSQLFSIGNKSSIIQTTKQIDRDVICPHQITCIVKFDVVVAPKEYFEVIKILVDILDINDHAPTFEKDDEFIKVSEQVEPGTFFSLPTATDIDSSTYGVQEYLLANKTKFGLQQIKGVDGSVDLRLVIRERLDREEADFYQFQMIAVDGGSPPRSGSILINIEVEDSNDNDPKFDNATYEVFVLENLPPDTTIARVQAQDIDAGPNGRVSYTFTDRTTQRYGDLFGIDPNTGTIYLKESLDFEHGSTYILVVEAHDQGFDSRPAYANVVVRVEDSNDNPPLITITSSTLIVNGIAQIAESSKPGTLVAHVSVMDQDGGDNGRVTCNINHNRFNMEELKEQNRYQIVTASTLDKEHEPQYKVTVSCHDLGFRPKTSTQEILIRILDDNDHVPRFSKQVYTVKIQEKNYVGAEIIKMNATDQDLGLNAEIRYSLDTYGDKLFNIKPNSGVITTKIVFDREKMDQYSFKVVAHDQGIPSLSSTATVLLTITDVNDEPPIFTQNSYALGVFENEPINTEVGHVVAIDRDTTQFNSLEYKFANPTSNVSRTFAIDPWNGKIITRKVLDRELNPVYYLTVIASSEEFPPMSSSASVTIYVADKNDNRPVIDWPLHYNNTKYISNLVPINYEVAKVEAHDRDIGGNGKLTYQITGGNHGNIFEINPAMGSLLTAKNIDNVEYEVFTLTIKVNDNGFPQLYSFANLNIIVNQSIIYSPTIQYTNNNPMIIITLTSASLLFLFLLIVAIILIRRQAKDKKSGPGCRYGRTESQKMLHAKEERDKVTPDGRQTPIVGTEWSIHKTATSQNEANYVVNMGCNDNSSFSQSPQSQPSSPDSIPVSNLTQLGQGLSFAPDMVTSSSKWTGHHDDPTQLHHRSNASVDRNHSVSSRQSLVHDCKRDCGKQINTRTSQP